MADDKYAFYSVGTTASGITRRNRCTPISCALSIWIASKVRDDSPKLLRTAAYARTDSSKSCAMKSGIIRIVGFVQDAVVCVSGGGLRDREYDTWEQPTWLSLDVPCYHRQIRWHLVVSRSPTGCLFADLKATRHCPSEATGVQQCRATYRSRRSLRADESACLRFVRAFSVRTASIRWLRHGSSL